MRLDPGWNQIVFDLADYVKRAYGTNYVETTRVTIHANCRLRRIYFTDRLYAEEELPAEFKLFLPVSIEMILLLSAFLFLMPSICRFKERHKHVPYIPPAITRHVN